MVLAFRKAVVALVVVAAALFLHGCGGGEAKEKSPQLAKPSGVRVDVKAMKADTAKLQKEIEAMKGVTDDLEKERMASQAHAKQLTGTVALLNEASARIDTLEAKNNKLESAIKEDKGVQVMIRDLTTDVEKLALQSGQDCETECKSNSELGRWRGKEYGHTCWNAASQKDECQCTASAVRAKECEHAPKKKQSLIAIEGAETNSTDGADCRVDQANLAEEDGDLATAAARKLESSVAELSYVKEARSRSQGSPRETVQNFCDVNGLAEMHGKDSEADLEGSGADAARDMESKILGDVARELEHNNVDKMAKEIFSFYVCVRWAPDKTFWTLAEQELTAQFAQAALKDKYAEPKEINNKAIAEMYRTYQFVPMLCSQNLQVYDETDSQDLTYFRKFEHSVKKLAEWIRKAGQDSVGQQLNGLDKTFCGEQSMISCNHDSMLDYFKSFFNSEHKTEAERWTDLINKIRGFGESVGNDPAFSKWKSRFPYHSFIAKPDGWQADKANSPMSAQRYVVCFGKRVASELHRRPSGRHILTDQNNIGCHGWYEAEIASAQLLKMVALWKPPTCQMAEMAYVMKKEILKRFQEMNERLFDSLPSMIHDEMEELEGKTWQSSLPEPYNPQEFAEKDGNLRRFVDKMLVQASRVHCSKYKEKDGRKLDECVSGYNVAVGDLGEVKVVGGVLKVVWQSGDAKSDAKSGLKEIEIPAAKLQILPHGWRAQKGLHEHLSDLVSGVSKITDKAKHLFEAMFSTKQGNLADLMSGSVSKWAVCPIKPEADLVALDAHLGVEDAAFQDFQKEAYKKWTGFEKATPGDECVDPKTDHSADVTKGMLSSLKECEINELHSDHLEKYTLDINAKPPKVEQFVCPLRPPLPAPEQLTVLKEKKGTCFLRLTKMQEVHYNWHYQGLFPARRQNERKPNLAKAEYELVKLLKVASGGPTSEVRFGRFCSLQELEEMPRFCNLPRIQNSWRSVSDMAASLSEALTGVPILNDLNKANKALAPLGVGASAVTDAVASYQAWIKKNASEKAKDAAITMSEKGWDSLRGANRLLHSSSKWLADHVKFELPGAGRMSVELDARLFGADSSGEVLHSLSFQRNISGNGQSSNAKERYQRFVMSHPCPDFEPALEFGLRKRWGRIALQVLAEAYYVRGQEKSGVFDQQSLHLQLRGEVLHYKMVREKTTDETSTPKASMSFGNAVEAVAPDCKFTHNLVGAKDGCEPSALCDWGGSFMSQSCKPKPWWQSMKDGKWWPILDTRLQEVVAPTVTTGNVDLKLLRGLKVSFYCGPKSAFGESGPPTASGEKLLDCLKKGIEVNAANKAKEPWKLFFPDEVVVVVFFESFNDRKCFLTAAGQTDSKQKDKLCYGLENGGQDEFKHLLDDKGTPPGSESEGVFQGAHAGAGFPEGTLSEVVLRPADVLEALRKHNLEVVPDSNA